MFTIQECFAVADSPVWMDSSTTEQCRDLEQKIGGSYELAQLTGSKAFERFTGENVCSTFSAFYNKISHITSNL